MALTYYRQIEDYVTALRAYLVLATGLPEDRLVFSPPDIAKRKLKEVWTKIKGCPPNGTNTRELDKFVSFHFPFTSPQQAYDRQSPQQTFWGSVAEATRRRGWQNQYDLPVQIDIWSGPDQRGKEFAFNTKLSLEHYLDRHQRIRVNFRDLITKDPTKTPPQTFDVNCYYEFLRWTTTENSHAENLFTEGAVYRATIEFKWMISLYTLDMVSPLIGKIREIIYMVQNEVTKEYETEWTAYSTTSTSSTTTVI